jgi:hypothetical protein
MARAPKARPCPPMAWPGWAEQARPILAALLVGPLPIPALKAHGGPHGWLQVLAWCDQRGLVEEAGGKWRLTTAGYRRAKEAA